MKKKFSIGLLLSSMVLLGDAVEDNGKLKVELERLEKERATLEEELSKTRETTRVLKIATERILDDHMKTYEVSETKYERVAAFATERPCLMSRVAGDPPKKAHWEKWFEVKPGTTYRFSVKIRAKEVVGTNVKFGLMVVVPGGKTQWPDARVGTGTFDWSDVEFTYTIPHGVDRVLLMCGVFAGKPEITGEVEFRDFVVEAVNGRR